VGNKINIDETIEKLVKLKGRVELDYTLEEQYADKYTIELLGYAIMHMIKYRGKLWDEDV